MCKKMLLALVFILSAATLSGQATAEDKKADKHSGLDRFKQLAGEWVGHEVGDGKKQEVHIKYKVTSGGSAVVETMFPGGKHEMITIIHEDGKNLALTHYCMLGNQPHMKADAKGDGDKYAFKFTGASNLKSDKEMHMHDVTYTFVDNDTLRAEWTHYMDGKKGGSVVFEAKRKK